MKNKGVVWASAIASGVVVVALTAGLAGFAIARTGEAVQARQAQSAKVMKTAAIKSLTDTQWIEKLRLEAEEEKRDAEEDKAEADLKAKLNAPDAAEEALDAQESAAEAAAAQKAYEDALAAQQNGQPVQPQPPAQPQSNGGQYKQQGGVVYEWDDNRWEPEYDKKINNGTVYEYDDGYWEPDYDNDWDDDWDDDDWDDDDD